MVLNQEEQFTGKVKFFNKKSKFGFIIVDDSNLEVYVRSTGLLEDVTADDLVTFQLQEHHKGPKAVRVKKVIG